jgi:glycerol-3-phosphate acyltransferase PlsX
VADARIARIAVDAMGGDHGPAVVVAGAVEAQRQLGDRAHLVLVGDEKLVLSELKRCGASPTDFEVVHAPDNIGMSEAPATAIRRRPESSIVVAANKMKRGEVDAFVSAGSTGAVAAASLMIVGRLPKVSRPAIASLLPHKKGMGLFLDAGANVDCKPNHLLQFAAMGKIYAERVLGQANTKVALMNIGEEPSKGNELSVAAHELLTHYEPAFIGNLEGRDIFEGKADVLVMDGFVGNVVLKVLESCGGFIAETFREAIASDLRAQGGAWLLKPALKEYWKRFDYAEYGGAPLLGCNGVIIICHGGSSAEAIKNAIRVADKGVEDGIPERIREEIEREDAEIHADQPQGASDAAPESRGESA